MKKLFVLLISITLLSCVFAFCPLGGAAAETDEYFIEGGRCVVGFDDIKDEELFDFYTEFDKLPYLMDGKLYAWTLAEQKMIFREKTYADVDVNVDISCINENGKFDSGIYVGAKNVSSKMDGITAWNVNIEHGAGSSVFALKLHRFQDGRWRGAVVEKLGLPYLKDKMNLRVVVKNGVLYAFLNHSKIPTFSYNIGNEVGMVGLRNFYSPNTFDNFTVIGEGNAVDMSQMEYYYNLATELVNKPLASDCMEELNAAIALKEGATTQKEVDAAAQALKTAVERAEEKHTYDELVALISKADGIENPQGVVYTPNSWNSLSAVKEICKTLSSESGEYEISYWYARLDARINGLIAYISEERA